MNEEGVGNKLLSMMSGYKPNPNNHRIYQKYEFVEISAFLEDCLENEPREHLKVLKPDYGSFVEFPSTHSNADEYHVGNYGNTYFKPKEEGDAEV